MELSERKKRILAAIIERYIETGEPVGSRETLSLTGMSVSSATIRNETSELTAMGYLEQPHASAGRVPSQKGYRYYVDNLMKSKEINKADRNAIEASLYSASGDPATLIKRAGEILAELTKCACVSAAPGGEAAIIKKIELVPVGSRAVMLALLTSNGILKSRLCRLECSLTPELSEKFYNLAASCAVGKPASKVSVADVQTAVASAGSDAIEILPLLAAACELARSAADSRITLGGGSNLFSHKDYGDDVFRLFEFLNKTEPLSAVVEEARDPLNVKIGRENIYRQLENSSVIIAKYSVRGDDSGTFGIIGPIRMDYENIIPSVKYLTDLAGRLITRAIEE